LHSFIKFPIIESVPFINLWNPYTVKPNIPYYTSFGPIELWVKRSHQDWYVATSRPSEESPARPLGPLPKGRDLSSLDWKRWVSVEEALSIRFIPALPDRSVVFRPQFPINVPQNQNLVFFINVPLWIRVRAGDSDGLDLWEVPSIVLSNTWFGDPTIGELCYDLKTHVMRNLEEVPNLPYTATCPININNQASTDLDFQRLCIRVEHLHVYQGKERLWTNQVEVVFKGEDLNSQINIQKYAPNYEQTSERLCAARQPVDKSLLKRSFYALRTLTGF